MRQLKTLVNYGRWYYDHGSTFLPVMTLLDGSREYPERLLRQGYDVVIRNATAEEHAGMAQEFDALVDRLAAGLGGSDDCFVSGLGNFKKGTVPSARVAEAVADLKARARVEPMSDAPSSHRLARDGRRSRDDP